MNRLSCMLTLALATCGTPGGPEAPSPAPSASAEPSRSPEAPSTAPSSSPEASPAALPPGEVPSSPLGNVIRFDVDGERYRIDLSLPGTVERCEAGAAEACRPQQTRTLAGSDLRGVLSALAERAETETCPPAEGAPVQLELGGRTLTFRLPPHLADRDYAPPRGDELDECAARALVRSAMTIVTWEGR